jgi:hypothetical protein
VKNHRIIVKSIWHLVIQIYFESGNLYSVCYLAGRRPPDKTGLCVSTCLLAVHPIGSTASVSRRLSLILLRGSKGWREVSQLLKRRSENIEVHSLGLIDALLLQYLQTQFSTQCPFNLLIQDNFSPGSGKLDAPKKKVLVRNS